MRVAVLEQPRLDCPSVDAISLNFNCRDEIIPILRALQHIYGQNRLRKQLLDLVSADVNRESDPDLGREGLSYWAILVLGSVRLGCNFDFDKLQDLAEQHRTLRLMMGIGDWDERVNFDWRRIRDNLALLQPSTLEKINHVVVAAGHELAPQAIEAVRGDSFVVQTNIHYPTESSLIRDGLGKVLLLAARLANCHDLPGWRQHEHVLKKVKKIVRVINRASRAKRQGADRLQPGYRRLLALAEKLLTRARRLLSKLRFRVPEGDGIDWLGKGFEGMPEELWHYLQLTTRVCDTARRRVLLGETVANEEKIFSLFEPHTELIKRGKQPNPIEFGHKVLVIEDAVGFICHYEVVANGVLDQDLMVPAMRKLQKRVAGKVRRASFDRAFHTPENQQKLAEIVMHPCLPKKGPQGAQQQEEATMEFRKARQNHPGVESAIGALQSGNGQERCRDKHKLGYERYVGLGILGRNLQTLGKLLLAQDDAECEAAKSKRKPPTG
jgi:transposase, IS5 family